MKNLILILLVMTGCSSKPEGDVISSSSNTLPAYYLDPHLHSPRSSDFGAHGIVVDTMDGIIQRAINEKIDMIWFTDHPGPNYHPFPSTASVYDGVEICDDVVYCYNEVYLLGAKYRLIVHPYKIDLKNPPFPIDAVEVIATGGSFETSEERSGLEEGILTIQAGYKPVFMGASNSHAGLPGANGLTAIQKSNLTIEQSIFAGSLTAIRNKIYTYFTISLTDKIAIQYPLTIQANYEFYRIDVFSDFHVTTPIPFGTKTLDKNKAALATFTKLVYNGKVVAITSPIYD